MKQLTFILSLSFILIQCTKIPTREQTTIRVTTVNDVAYVEGSQIKIEYGLNADIVFEYVSDTELDFSFIKLTKNLVSEDVNSSDDQYITNHPQPGDLSGTFTYTINTTEQFDEPIGNPVVDRKTLRVIIMNSLGTVKELNLFVLPI